MINKFKCSIVLAQFPSSFRVSSGFSAGEGEGGGGGTFAFGNVMFKKRDV